MVDPTKTAPLGTAGHWEEEATVVWTPEWAGDESAPREATEPEEAQPVKSEPRPDVELQVRKVPIERAEASPVVYEIWTKNRVYNLDSRLRCFEVIDLATGTPNKKHAFIGAILVGGQRQTKKSTELSFPLPSPGSEAVFQKANEKNRIVLSTTSKVSRVMLHIQRTIVPVEQKDQTWGKITTTEAKAAKV